MASGMRELVTILRYELQEGRLKQYVDGYNAAEKKINDAAKAASGKLNEALKQTVQPARKLTEQVRQVERNLQQTDSPARRLSRTMSRLTVQAREFGIGLGQGARQGAGEAIRQLDRVEARQRRLRREAIGKTKDGIAASVIGPLRGLLAGVGVHELARMSDEWQQEQATIGLYTKDTAQRDRSRDFLFKQSQRQGVSYPALAGTFSQISPSFGHEGFTNDQILVLTDLLGKAGTLGKGGPEGTKLALVQFAQAAAKGKLGWADFKLIEQQSEGITQSILKALNITQAEAMKRMSGKGGGIDVKEVANALLAYQGTIDKQFSQMPQGFGQGVTKIHNALMRVVGEWNEQYKIATRFNALMTLIAGNMGQIVRYAMIAGGAFASFKVLGAAVGAMTALRSGMRVLALFIARASVDKWDQAFAKLGPAGLRFLGAIRWIGTAVSAVGAAIGAIGLTPLLAVAAVLIGAALVVWKYWRPIKAFFIGIWEGLTAGMEGVGAQISAAFAPLGPVFSQLGQWLGEAWDWFVKLVDPANATAGEINSAADAGMLFGAILASVIRGGIDGIGFLIESIVAIGTWIGETAAKIDMGFTSAWVGIKNGVTELWAWITAKFTAGWDAISGMIPDWLKTGATAALKVQPGATTGTTGAFGVTPAAVQRTGLPGATNVTQNATVTVNAQGASNPASVGAAAEKGTRKALDSTAPKARTSYAPHTTTEVAA